MALRMSDTDPIDVLSASGATIAVIRPNHAQIDETQVDLVNRRLLELASTTDQPVFVLDLTHVEFFGSSFIEGIFRVWKRLQGRQGSKFAICGLRPYCREVLEITHLDRLWPLYATRDEALAQLQAD
jgi:anti-sigma B factor antagonist